MTKELRNPPHKEVEWTIAHRDGRVGKAMARTAFAACYVLCWAFMDIIHASAEW
jgi:hypothetical protein